MATQEKQKAASHSGMAEQSFEAPWAEVAVLWPTHVEPQQSRTRSQVGTWESTTKDGFWRYVDDKK